MNLIDVLERIEDTNPFKEDGKDGFSYKIQPRISIGCYANRLFTYILNSLLRDIDY